MKNSFKYILSIALVLNVLYAGKTKQTVSFGQDIEYKKVILIEGKNINEVMASAQDAITELSEEDKKNFINAISILVKKNIEDEKKTLISRKLTTQDINEIKVDTLSGKTVVNIIEEAKIVRQGE